MSKKNNGKALVTFDMLTEFYHELIKPQFDQLNEKMDNGFAKLQKEIKKNGDDIQEIKVKVDHLDDQFDGLKAEFSNVPTRKEFNDLKSEVRSISS